MKNPSSAKLSMWAVIAVVVFQFLIAALGLILFARSVRIEMAEYSTEVTHSPDLRYVLGGLLATIVVCAISAIGLLMPNVGHLADAHSCHRAAVCSLGGESDLQEAFWVRFHPGVP
jgi:hypothetical protein